MQLDQFNLVELAVRRVADKMLTRHVKDGEPLNEAMHKALTEVAYEMACIAQEHAETVATQT